MVAYLTNLADQKIELSDAMCNRIGSGPNVEAKLDKTQPLHAAIRKVGPAWILMNLTYDARSVRHRGHSVTDYVEIGNGDLITINGQKLRFHKS